MRKFPTKRGEADYLLAGSSSAGISSGFVLVYVLIGLNIASLVVTKKKQTLYDLLAGTYTFQGEP